jgi:hypothetical protein
MGFRLTSPNPKNGLSGNRVILDQTRPSESLSFGVVNAVPTADEQLAQPRESARAALIR